MKQKSGPVVKSATRAIDVLELVATASEPPSFALIGSELQIPSSSLFYLLNTLLQRGYLQQDGVKGGYRIGPAVASLAGAASLASWATFVEPLVDQIWKHTKETSSFFERRGDEMQCMIVKLGQHSLIPIHRVGQRTPLHVFSGGKIVLADMPEQDLDAYLKRAKYQRFTPNTLMSATAVRKEVDKVRASGLGISREEHSVGTIGMSVGLRAPTGLIGTLGIAVPAVRFDETILASVHCALTAAASDFEQMLSGRGFPEIS